MRENIGLFRGKRIDTKKWVEGSFYQHPMTKDCFILVHNYYSCVVRGFGNLGSPEFYTVDPDSIGECTGLMDKNGKLLFEGDAIKYKDRTFGEIVAVIEYSKGGCYCAHMLRSPNSPALDIVMNESEIEIIGTIHDKEVWDESK